LENGFHTISAGASHHRNGARQLARHATGEHSGAGATLTHSVREAVDLLREADRSDVIFITGSLFVVGEARALLVQ